MGGVLRCDGADPTTGETHWHYPNRVGGPEIRRQLPEVTIVSAPAGLTAVSDCNCHVDTELITQVKLLGTCVISKIDVQFGVTYQATPGRRSSRAERELRLLRTKATKSTKLS
jgi:hypothetical protein